MPFRSKAQRRFMFAAEAEGKLPKGTAKRWASHTKTKRLPERVRRKRAEFVVYLLKQAQRMNSPVLYKTAAAISNGTNLTDAMDNAGVADLSRRIKLAVTLLYGFLDEQAQQTQ